MILNVQMQVPEIEAQIQDRLQELLISAEFKLTGLYQEVNNRMLSIEANMDALFYMMKELRGDKIEQNSVNKELGIVC